jgi:uncharacterized peroxidase-related enzyme
MTSVAKLNKPAKATGKATAPKARAAKAPSAKAPSAKGPPAKAPSAKGPLAKAPPAKAPLAKAPIAKAPMAKAPLANPLAKLATVKSPAAPIKPGPFAKPKPLVGETPRRQDGEPAPMALALPPGDLSPEMRAYLEKCREKIGFVPHVLTSYAHDDGKLAAFAAFYNDLMLGPSGLSKLEREMIAVAVSSENHCFYCLTAHGAAVRQLSGDPVLGELMAMNWRAAKLSARHRAMLGFASKVTLHSRQINEADRENLRKAGFSNRDIWDIAAVASFFNMSNRMASAVDMRPNREYHTQAR